MILTLMCIGVFVIGVAALVVNGKFKFSWKIHDILFNVGIACVAIGLFCGLIAVCVALGNAARYDLDYQNALHEREVIEYRLDHMSENITGNEMLYNDIVEFNNMLRSQKKWANNPWTSWFNNKNIAALDYIELSGE